MLGKNELAEGCPLDQLAAMNVAIPTDNLDVYAKQTADKMNVGIAELRRLLLVENMVIFFKS